ncbi:hypothetical protein ILYODFUR_000948 [Ilyodon furcidens]|uniref:Uncharacterized protein n=1 Tax=Ilyodon furcidens TaxID=33524 RepID=A0ABV0UMW1_9TELE
MYFFPDNYSFNRGSISALRASALDHSFLPVNKFILGCTVAQLVALLPCSKKILGKTPWPGVFLRGVCIFSLCMCGFPLGTPGFLPQTKDIPVRSICLCVAL